MGHYAGAKAEYVRVPFEEWACLKLHEEHGDEFEDDFIILQIYSTTAYYGFNKRDDTVKPVIIV